MMRRLGLLPAVAVLVWCSTAHAQSSVDVNIGFGSASDSASGAGLDNASSVNAFGGCNPRSGDPFCQATPSLSPFFLGFGGDIMLFKKLGAGFEANITPTRH